MCDRSTTLAIRPWTRAIQSTIKSVLHDGTDRQTDTRKWQVLFFQSLFSIKQPRHEDLLITPGL